MKLPTVGKGSVQPLKTTPAGVYAEAGNAVKGAWNAAGKAAEVAYNINDQYEVTEAQMSAVNGLTKFRQDYGNKETFTVEELEDLGWDVPNTTEQVVINGKTETVERSEIPAYEVYPQALENEWRRQAEVASKKISRPKSRNAFDSGQQEMLANAMVKERARAETLQRQYQEKRRDMMIDEATASGNYAGARGLVSNSNLDKQEKIEATRIINVHEEDNQIRTLAHQGSDLEIMDMVDQLKGKSPYDGHLDKEQRDKYIGLLNSTLNQRKQAHDKLKDRIVGDTWRQLALLPDEEKLNFLLSSNDGVALAAQIPGKEFKSMVDYATKPAGAVKTDFGVWYNLDTLRQHSPDKFLQLNLDKYINDLSGPDLKALAKHQEDMRAPKDPGKMLSTSSVTQQKNRAMEVLGFDGMPERTNEFNRLVDGELHLLEVELGRTPNPKEVQSVVDNLMIDEVTSAPGMFGRQQRDVSLNDIPTKRWDINANALRNIGVRLTDTNLYRMDQVLLGLADDGIDNPTQAQIEAAFIRYRNADTQSRRYAE